MEPKNILRTKFEAKTSKFGDVVLYPYYNGTVAPYNARMKLVESHDGGIQPARGPYDFAKTPYGFHMAREEHVLLREYLTTSSTCSIWPACSP